MHPGRCSCVIISSATKACVHLPATAEQSCTSGAAPVGVPCCCSPQP